MSSFCKRICFGVGEYCNILQYHHHGWHILERLSRNCLLSQYRHAGKLASGFYDHIVCVFFNQKCNLLSLPSIFSITLTIICLKIKLIIKIWLFATTTTTDDSNHSDGYSKKGILKMFWVKASSHDKLRVSHSDLWSKELCCNALPRNCVVTSYAAFHNRLTYQLLRCDQ